MADHFKVPAAACPKCGKTSDCVAPVLGEEHPRGPRPGDVTVCVYCGNLMGFGPDLELIEVDLDSLSAEELADVLTAVVDVLGNIRGEQ